MNIPRLLARFATSTVLGLVLALPFTSLMPSLVNTVRAETITTDELLSSDFSEATGLPQGDLQQSLGNLINVALGFLGIIAVVIVLYGGFKWMTAGGNDEKISEAKHLIIAGIIGLAIILSAFAITNFVISSILDATG